MAIDREYVVWGYRLFLNREPESDEVVDHKARIHETIAQLRRDFVGSAEFQQGIGAVAPSLTSNVVIKEIEPGLRLFIDLADEAIGAPIASGIYEPAERAFVEHVVHPGDVAIDVGANVGFFTVLLAARVQESGHVHAFEPLPRNATLLERTILENAFTRRITLHRAAVGAARGELELVSPRATVNWGGAYLRTSCAEVPSGHDATSVPVIALDDLPIERPVRLIKLDAEGAELLVLSGARQLLRRDRPIVLAEINPQQLRAVSNGSSSDLLQFMQQHGYQYRAVDASRPLSPNSEDIVNVVFET